MFGYLTADVAKLSEEELQRYRACYCGLCRCLGQRLGQLSRLTLNYDMTFLILLLESLYEPEERQGLSRCAVHPVHARAWMRSEVTEYAADMNLALAWYKCRDDWADERRLGAAAAAKFLEGRCWQIARRYPRQCAAMEEMMAALSQAEKSEDASADGNAAIFGRMMGEILVWREDRWSDTLRQMGRSLGEFLYIMDACMDLDEDLRRGRYNPFREYHACPDNEQRFRDFLKMLLGQCLYAFDRLPLVQDVGILKNILCAGLWAQFEQKYNKTRDNADVSGPV